MITNLRNERTKREFFKKLKEADGCCEATVNSIENAILLYENFTKREDFQLFTPDKAIEFKKWLIKKEHNGKTIQLTTYHTYLRSLRKFFIWLSGQTGYKSKIKSDYPAYLNISTKEERVANQSTPRNFPSLEYVINLTSSIKINSEIDLRDRALISLTALTGIRDKAISTLCLECFDDTNLIIKQDPKMGVETKFSKFIPTMIFNFDDQLLNNFLEWVKLSKKKGFGSQDPLFPRSKKDQGINNLSFKNATEVEPIFWKGTGRIREIFKHRAKEANLPYFAPHTFRHLAIDLALKSCKNGEQIKAISQNFGHENVATTLYSYANFDTATLHNIIKGIDFSGKEPDTKDKKLDQIRKILLDQ